MIKGNSLKKSRSKDPIDKNKSPKLNKIPKTISSRESKDLKTTVSSNLNKSKENNNNVDLNLNKTESLNNNKNETAFIQNPNNLNLIKHEHSSTNDNYNFKLTNLSFINNDTELKILDLKKELNQRGLLIFEGILNVIEFSKLDPILEVFKLNSSMHQFFINRILELIIEALNNEREKSLEAMLIENKSLTKKFSEFQENSLKEMRETEEKIKFFVNKIKISEDALIEKEESIKNLQICLQETQDKYNEMMFKNEQILIESEKKEIIIQNVLKENESLKQKINFIENNPKYANMEKEYHILKMELANKNSVIISNQNKMNEMKASHEELITKINCFYEENSNVKNELEKKNYLIEELIGKIEALRLEFDNKAEEKKKEMDELGRINQTLNENINNTYKQKITALKVKLREKVNALVLLEKQFEEYKGEKEKILLRYMQSNQKLINDKNQIISDLIRNKND